MDSQWGALWMLSDSNSSQPQWWLQSNDIWKISGYPWLKGVVSSHHCSSLLPASTHLTQRTFHPLGTPDTRRRGRSTRKALRALTSKPPCPLRRALSITLTLSRITVKTLQDNGQRKWWTRDRSMVGTMQMQQEANNKLKGKFLDTSPRCSQEERKLGSYGFCSHSVHVAAVAWRLLLNHST